MITTEQAKEFIINTHPDPDNIYVTYRDIFCNSQIAVKERDLYSLMKQFANHCIEEYKESLKEEIEEIRQLTKCEKVYTPNIHSIDIEAAFNEIWQTTENIIQSLESDQVSGIQTKCPECDSLQFFVLLKDKTKYKCCECGHEYNQRDYETKTMKDKIKEILIKHSIDDFDIGAKVLLTNIETIANEIIQSIETEQESEEKCKHHYKDWEHGAKYGRCKQCGEKVKL